MMNMNDEDPGLTPGRMSGEIYLFDTSEQDSTISDAQPEELGFFGPSSDLKPLEYVSETELKLSSGSGEILFPSAGYPYTRTLARWLDPFTLPKSRSSCAKWAIGDLPFGGGYKICVGWKTQFKYMYVTAKLRVVTGDKEDIKKAVAECLLISSVAAALSAIATEGAAALPAFKAALASCLTAKLATLWAVDVYTESGWGNWE